MLNLKKYLKAFLLFIIPVLIFNIFITTITYFNIINSNIISYFKLLIVPISIFISGYYLGNKTIKRGWIEGIKIGLVVCIIISIIKLFIGSFNYKALLFFIIIIFSAITGSMLGINKKKN